MKKTISLLLLGGLLAGLAIPAAYRQRGYFAFGGEYMLIIAPLLADELWRTLKDMFAEEKEKEPQELRPLNGSKG